jgi:CheY-like chemotaxis protein
VPRLAKIRLTFPKEEVAATATMLWVDAPATCTAIADLLPVAGAVHHAVYSGSEVVLLLPELLRLAPEHATAAVSRGDVAYTWFAGGSSYGVDRDFSEICWFYDIDARPSMWEGPVPVNVFARIDEPAGDFYAICRRIRREGIKPFSIESAD